MRRLALKLLRFIRGLRYDWQNRNTPNDVCCCGDPDDHDAWNAGHSPVNAYKYYKDLYVYGPIKNPVIKALIDTP